MMVDQVINFIFGLGFRVPLVPRKKREAFVACVSCELLPEKRLNRLCLVTPLHRLTVVPGMLLLFALERDIKKIGATQRLKPLPLTADRNFLFFNCHFNLNQL